MRARTHVVVGAVTLLAGACLGQESPPSRAPAAKHAGAKEPVVGGRLESKKRAIADAERALRKLRADYFDQARPAKDRQVAIAKVAEYADPKFYPAIVEVLVAAGGDAATVALDHLAAQDNDEAEVSIAWTAVFDKRAATRDAAKQRLAARFKAHERRPENLRLIVYQALAHGSEDAKREGAQLANQLGLIEAIPLLITAQVGGGGASGAGGGGGLSQGDLAYILVGTQQAFVEDLEPVVGESAVAFDPQLATITEGTILRIIDAHAVIYRADVRTALVDLTTREWGKPTDHLGWSQKAWRDWHKDEFQPFIARREAARMAERLAKEAAAREAKDAATRDAGTSAPPKNPPPPAP